MNDELLRHDNLLRDLTAGISTLQAFVAAGDVSRQLLTEAVSKAEAVHDSAAAAGEDSFRLISKRLAALFQRCSNEQRSATSVEGEVVELATDWLVQLAALYRERIPEPKALVAELLYAFELVDHYREATNLAELLETHGKTSVSQNDPFVEDPGFAVEDRPVPQKTDPFAEDPGFGMEFDLLQRTLNLSARHELSCAPGEDPFAEDPGLETAPAGSTPEKGLPYDVFASDPPMGKSPED